MKNLKKYTCEVKEFANGVYTKPVTIYARGYTQAEAVQSAFKIAVKRKFFEPQTTLACAVVATVSLKGLNLPNVDYKRLENFIINHPDSFKGDDKRYSYRELELNGLILSCYFPTPTKLDAFIVVKEFISNNLIFWGQGKLLNENREIKKVYQTKWSTKKGVERYSRVANDKNFDMSRIDAMVNAFELEQKLSKDLSVKEEQKRVRKI